MNFLIKKNNGFTHTNFKKSLGGFTLIELLVSLTLLSIVLTIGLGLVLTTSSAIKQSRSQRRAMDNLNFAIESMSRSITYGHDFSCFSASFTSDCGITTVGSSDIYFKGNYLGTPNVDFHYVRSIDPNTNYGYISRTIGSGSAVSLTSDRIDIKELTFYVYNTEDYGSNTQQPRVVVTIKGVSHAGNTPQEFLIQTTLSQRDLKL
jgi:prepilin-type N-terminal cleavage/methylation domain-containing protein